MSASAYRYEFVEYPKWVHPEGRSSVIVQSAEEEAAILAAADRRQHEQPHDLPHKRGPGRPRIHPLPDTPAQPEES